MPLRWSSRAAGPRSCPPSHKSLPNTLPVLLETCATHASRVCASKKGTITLSACVLFLSYSICNLSVCAAPGFGGDGAKRGGSGRRGVHDHVSAGFRARESREVCSRRRATEADRAIQVRFDRLFAVTITRRRHASPSPCHMNATSSPVTDTHHGHPS